MVHTIVSYYLTYKISNTLITLVNTELKKKSASMTNPKKYIYPEKK